MRSGCSLPVARMRNTWMNILYLDRTLQSTTPAYSKTCHGARRAITGVTGTLYFIIVFFQIHLHAYLVVQTANSYASTRRGFVESTHLRPYI